MKQRVTTVVNVAKTCFHWGFIPTVLYLGIDLVLSLKSARVIQQNPPEGVYLKVP